MLLSLHNGINCTFGWHRSFFNGGNKHVKLEINPIVASGGHNTTIIAELLSGNHRSSIRGQCNIVQELEAPQIDASSAKVAIDGKNLVVGVGSHGAVQYGYDHLEG